MANNLDNFDDFDDFSDNLDWNETLGGINTDDTLLLDDSELEEEQTGGSRTFLIIALVLLVLFVILVAVFAALVLFNPEECNENCQLATQISGTNQAIETSIRSSETAISEQGTATQISVETLSAEATGTAVILATNTANAEATFVAATSTQQEVDAASTQLAAERTATAEFIASQVTDTPTATDTPAVAQEIRGQLEGPLAQEGLTICIFRDNGDGEFNPSTDVENPNCSPVPVAAVPEDDGGVDTTDVIGTGGGADETTGDSTGADTVSAPPTEELEAPTAAPLNSIFQTATAINANREGDIATPTAEGSSLNPPIRGKAIPRDGENSAPHQTGDEDSFETFVITEANGEFVLPPLPPGEYWIAVGDQTLQINVQDNVADQVFTFPSDDPNATITIVVQGTGGVETLSPIFQTASAVAGSGTSGETVTPESVAGNAQTQTSVAETGMPTTGLFDGEGGDVTGTDLLILGIMGIALLSVIFIMRSARNTLAT